jgi:hypothetical protein
MATSNKDFAFGIGDCEFKAKSRVGLRVHLAAHARQEERLLRDKERVAFDDDQQLVQVRTPPLNRKRRLSEEAAREHEDWEPSRGYKKQEAASSLIDSIQLEDFQGINSEICDTYVPPVEGLHNIFERSEELPITNAHHACHAPNIIPDRTLAFRGFSDIQSRVNGTSDDAILGGPIARLSAEPTNVLLAADLMHNAQLSCRYSRLKHFHGCNIY